MLWRSKQGLRGIPLVVCVRAMSYDPRTTRLPASHGKPSCEMLKRALLCFAWLGVAWRL